MVGSGQIIEGQVQARAGLQQLADLVIRFVASQRGIDFDKYNFRHTQAKGAPDLAGDQLRDQRQHSLSRSAKFDDIEPKIVGLHNCGQRTAFPQRAAHNASHLRFAASNIQFSGDRRAESLKQRSVTLRLWSRGFFAMKNWLSGFGQDGRAHGAGGCWPRGHEVDGVESHPRDGPRRCCAKAQSSRPRRRRRSASGRRRDDDALRRCGARGRSVRPQGLPSMDSLARCRPARCTSR